MCWCRTATTGWDRVPTGRAPPTACLPGSSPSQKGVQGESNSRPLRPERRIMPLDHAPTAYKSNRILEPGIEPGTYCVLGSRHNQLDHGCTSNILGGTRTLNLEIRSLTPYPVRPRGQKYRMGLQRIEASQRRVRIPHLISKTGCQPLLCPVPTYLACEVAIFSLATAMDFGCSVSGLTRYSIT